MGVLAIATIWIMVGTTACYLYFFLIYVNSPQKDYGKKVPLVDMVPFVTGFIGAPIFLIFMLLIALLLCVDRGSNQHFSPLRGEAPAKLTLQERIGEEHHEIHNSI